MAPDGPVYIYRALATAVHDGDTFTAEVDLGFRVSLKIQVRLQGINAPELHDPAGEPAQRWLAAQLIPEGIPANLLLESYRDQRSFERWVCDVWLLGRDQSISEAAVEAGIARAMRRSGDRWVEA